jgi:hypothetical protein
LSAYSYELRPVKISLNTYASLLAEARADTAYTKSQIGQKSAKLTLEVYTDAGNRRHSARLFSSFRIAAGTLVVEIVLLVALVSGNVI